MRLDKFVTSASDYSRSEVKRLIKNKTISVNQAVVTNPAQHIKDSDEVYYLDQRLETPTPRYFMLHKPQGCVCANQDSEHQTVLDLIDTPNKSSLQIAGRLDKDTTGLVLITDDGQWNHRVTSPNKKQFKIYRVTLENQIEAEAIEQLEQGVQLNNEKHPTQPAKVSLIDKKIIELSIQEGKYHQVKRMLAAVGNHVVALHRIQIGEIFLDAQLQQGEYRALNNDEVNSI